MCGPGGGRVAAELGKNNRANVEATAETPLARFPRPFIVHCTTATAKVGHLIVEGGWLARARALTSPMFSVHR